MFSPSAHYNIHEYVSYLFRYDGRESQLFFTFTTNLRQFFSGPSLMIAPG